MAVAHTNYVSLNYGDTYAQIYNGEATVSRNGATVTISIPWQHSGLARNAKGFLYESGTWTNENDSNMYVDSHSSGSDNANRFFNSGTKTFTYTSYAALNKSYTTYEYGQGAKASSWVWSSGYYFTVAVAAASFTVGFNANGGATPSFTSKSVSYGSSYGTLPTTSRAGYTFAGWWTAASGGTQVTDSTTVGITEDQTLYARWTANTYTVTLNANGGTVTPGSITVRYASTYGTLPTPVRTGYQFLGWYTEETGGTLVTSGTQVTITAAQTLYARWEALSILHLVSGGTVTTVTKIYAVESGTVKQALGVYSVKDGVVKQGI